MSSDLFLHSQKLFLLLAAFSSTDHLEDFFNTYFSIRRLKFIKSIFMHNFSAFDDDFER